jgi:NADH:ubiquinone reductase (H+-translocating)
MSTAATSRHRVVIVGGGFGGLSAAKALRRVDVDVTVIDRTSRHVNQPMLAQVAMGTLSAGDIAPSISDILRHHRNARVVLGDVVGMDLDGRRVTVETIDRRTQIAYDSLIVAAGASQSYFGHPEFARDAPGVKTIEHALELRDRIRGAFELAQHESDAAARRRCLTFVVVGAGATGVELAAELHRTTREMVAYGLDRVDADKDIRVMVIEAAPRVLPALPERLSQASEKLLRELGVDVHTGAKVAEVQAGGVRLADGRLLPAELIVWAAGVKAPDLLKDIAGLETNRINQLVVRQTLQSTRDDDIFAIGDCAACAWPQANGGKGGFVPPRAQAAHQHASHVTPQIKRRLAGKPLKDYRYRDFGSLVSLGEYSTVGNMMGGLIGGSLMIEGLFARLMYLSLYKMHELALHGSAKVALDTLARLIVRRTEPHVKLH